VTGFHKRKLQRRKEAQECAAAPALLCVLASLGASTGRAARRKLEEKARKLRLEERAKARARRAPARAAHALLVINCTATKALAPDETDGVNPAECSARVSACEWVPP
jgi:shikimate 5-dehydrogenase